MCVQNKAIALENASFISVTGDPQSLTGFFWGEFNESQLSFTAQFIPVRLEAF